MTLNPSYKPSAKELFPKLPVYTTVDYDVKDQQLINVIQEFLDTNSKYQLSTSKPNIYFEYDDPTGESPFISQPLVPVIHRQTLLDNIDTTKIQSTPSGIYLDDEYFDTIVVVSSMKEQIGKKLNLDNDDVVSFDDVSQVIDQVAVNPNYLGLIPLSDLTVDVHPLSLDTNSALKNPSTYPLSIDIYYPAKHHNDSLLNFIKKNYQQYDPAEILAVGDIMMGRYVGVKINRSGDPAHSVVYVSEELAKPDITFAQLETPIAPTNYTSEGMILIAQPETVEALTVSGVDIVSISGNHFGDALRDGMQYSFDLLDENNIAFIGAGPSEEEAFSHKIVQNKGIDIGFLTFVNIMPNSYGAQGNIAGTAWVDFDSLDDQEKIISSIQKAKSESDILFVGFHWGTEYTPNPTQTQQNIAHLAIDNGADMIIGTHPHVVQADEIYKGKYINYSLGNFVMDQMWSTETQEGVLLYIYTINDDIISYDLIPTHAIDYSQVRIMDKEEGSSILNRIWDASNIL